MRTNQPNDEIALFNAGRATYQGLLLPFPLTLLHLWKSAITKGPDVDSEALYPQQRFLNTKIRDGSFWARWRAAARDSTIPTQLGMLKRTGRYKAFDLEFQE